VPLARRGCKVGWEMRLIAQARRPRGVANCEAAACSSGPPTSPAWLLTRLPPEPRPAGSWPSHRAIPREHRNPLSGAAIGLGMTKDLAS
jgi:hypothetical protein